ncbi:MAG: hypothetical protein MR270_04070 [Erysipelotrichaceae bacterium]|nr:hypothetical protein [Erysipelotrichaceae bacterium]
MKKNRFYGKYYKFIAKDGFSFAIIIAISNEGKSIQLITKQASFNIKDIKQVEFKDNIFHFMIKQDDLSFEGKLSLGKLHPLKKKVMGPFSYIPLMECKHDIYSMYHTVEGSIKYNEKDHLFINAIGYIEGDKGINFPKKYIWYNSVLPDNKAVTLAIASIPFGLFTFTGVLCFIKIKEKEYYMCTWNNVKIKQLKKSELILKKGKYQLVLNVIDDKGFDLSAPQKGNMSRYIKENIAVKSTYKFLYNDQVILHEEDELSSLEWMWND